MYFSVENLSTSIPKKKGNVNENKQHLTVLVGGTFGEKQESSELYHIRGPSCWHSGHVAAFSCPLKGWLSCVHLSLSKAVCKLISFSPEISK